MLASACCLFDSVSTMASHLDNAEDVDFITKTASKSIASIQKISPTHPTTREARISRRVQRDFFPVQINNSLLLLVAVLRL